MQYCRNVLNHQGYRLRKLETSIVVAGSLTDAINVPSCFRTNFDLEEEFVYLIDGGTKHDLLVNPAKGLTLIVANAKVKDGVETNSKTCFDCDHIICITTCSSLCTRPTQLRCFKLEKKSGFEIYPVSEEQDVNAKKFTEALEKRVRNIESKQLHVRTGPDREHLRCALMQALLVHAAFVSNTEFMDVATLENLGVSQAESCRAEDYYERAGEYSKGSEKLQGFLSKLANRTKPYSNSGCDADMEKGLIMLQKMHPSQLKFLLSNFYKNQKSGFQQSSRQAISRIRRFFK